MTAIDEITTLLQSLVAPWNAGDVAGVSGRYSEDGRLITPFGHDARGRDAVHAIYHEYLADGPLKGSQTTMDVEDVRLLADDVAVVDCHQVISESDFGVMDLHLTAIAKRGAAGWKLAEARPYAFLPIPVPAA